MPENIFEDEWRECLRAHYMHVIRTRDKVTEPSLTVVMGQVGFTEADLAELRVRATMHMDDVGDDFVPELTVLDAEPRTFAAAAPEAPPAEPPVPEDQLPDEQLVEEVEAAAAEAELPDEAPPDEPTPDEPDAPQQLTLF